MKPVQLTETIKIYRVLITANSDLKHNIDEKEAMIRSLKEISGASEDDTTNRDDIIDVDDDTSNIGMHRETSGNLCNACDKSSRLRVIRKDVLKTNTLKPCVSCVTKYSITKVNW